MKLNKKQYIGGAIVLIILVIGVFIYSRKQANNNVVTNNSPTDQILPTIDSSVKVDLISSKKGEAVLSINNAPDGTKSIEFELSYLVINADTSEGGSGTVSQGAIGKCYESNNVWECGEPSGTGRKIVLGTCSSGVCRYHNITGPITVSLKFTGDYGEKIFTKNYQL